MLPYKWYVNRAKVMSIRELFTMRLYRSIRDICWRTPVNTPSDLPGDLTYFDDTYADYYHSQFSHLSETDLEPANHILENRITLFGREVCLDSEVNWYRDYVSCVEWPGTGIPYRASTTNDPKYVWELNRQQFLPILGKAYFLTSDERYAKKAIDFIVSWIDRNPPHKGINWESGIELALRQLSWLWTLRFIARSRYLSEQVRQKIYASFYLQTAHISRNLSLFSSANNHLISELAAMVIIGAFLHQDKWVSTGLHLLTEEIDHQILPDGVGAEQSPAYQIHTHWYYLQAINELRKHRIQTPKKVIHGIERSATFIRSMLDQKDVLANFGDNDSGNDPVLSLAYSNIRSLLNMTSIATGNKDMMLDDAGMDDKLFWMLGPQEFSVLQSHNSVTNRKEKPDFPSGGYYILRNTLNRFDVKVIFDCGPLGMKPLAGHGHADSLSFILSVNDHKILVDPGTYSYHADSRWRNYFRGTSAHNTVRLDGRDQSDFGGKFLALGQAESLCTGWSDGVMVSGRHTGYRRLEHPAIHHRTITVEQDSALLKICDRIESEGDHLVEQFFHVSPQYTLRRCGANQFEIHFSDGVVKLQMDDCLCTSVYSGDEALPLGWVSSEYGHKEPAFTIVGRSRINKPKQFITTIGF